MATCPFCSEMIGKDTDLCPHCGRSVDTSWRIGKPDNLAELQRNALEEKQSEDVMQLVKENEALGMALFLASKAGSFVMTRALHQASQLPSAQHWQVVSLAPSTRAFAVTKNGDYYIGTIGSSGKPSGKRLYYHVYWNPKNDHGRLIRGTSEFPYELFTY